MATDIALVFENQGNLGQVPNFQVTIFPLTMYHSIQSCDPPSASGIAGENCVPENFRFLQFDWESFGSLACMRRFYGLVALTQVGCIVIEVAVGGGSGQRVRSDRV